MPRSGDIDETDRRILELIKTHWKQAGEGPTYQEIGDVLNVVPSAIYYRVYRKLIPAGLVSHRAYERGSLKVIEP